MMMMKNLMKQNKLQSFSNLKALHLDNKPYYDIVLTFNLFFLSTCCHLTCFCIISQLPMTSNLFVDVFISSTLSTIKV